eukprot:CAMPEP_0168329118 /NCGR_PEP_ID=MMETSP0213-20121227/6916_1 /TAXON_ID=151035 /ORGANISM="Euplotes harpa, Strain FSP1.4" /LENGTH=209 /DNA_ID=CAMNT_0008332379 /DNA_START=823 /DNA_END=1453 /DNA_ORIENTATION=-
MKRFMKKSHMNPTKISKFKIAKFTGFSEKNLKLLNSTHSLLQVFFSVRYQLAHAWNGQQTRLVQEEGRTFSFFFSSCLDEARLHGSTSNFKLRRAVEYFDTMKNIFLQSIFKTEYVLNRIFGSGLFWLALSLKIHGLFISGSKSCLRLYLQVKPAQAQQLGNAEVFVPVELANIGELGEMPKDHHPEKDELFLGYAPLAEVKSSDQIEL